jgi:hypothetical protein
VLLEEQLVRVLSGPRQPDRKVVAEPPQLIVPATSTKRQRQAGQVGVLFAEQLCNQIRGDLRQAR